MWRVVLDVATGHQIADLSMITLRTLHINSLSTQVGHVLLTTQQVMIAAVVEHVLTTRRLVGQPWLLPETVLVMINHLGTLILAKDWHRVLHRNLLLALQLLVQYGEHSVR